VSVSLYLGLPGDGKSMSGVRRVVETLTISDRTVVTNLPLEVGELETYLRLKYKLYDATDRITLLTQEQVRKFWLIRGRGWRLVDLADDDWSKNKFPSLQRVFRYVPSYDVLAKRRALETLSQADIDELIRDGSVEEGDLGKEKLGCLYVIDECQNFWPARSYQSTPKGLLFYLSQHRHVGDDCCFITQKESQVEKTIRNLVSEFWVYRRLGTRRRMGFRLPDVFGYACYNEPPGLVGSQYQAIGTFRMDVNGLAPCYRTADGVGVGGATMVADVGSRKKGVSWMVAVVLLVLFLVGVALLPMGLGKVIGGFLLGAGASVGSNMVHTAVVPVAVQESNVVKAGVEQPVVSRPVRMPVKSPSVSTNWVKGAYRAGDGQWHVVLSNGRRLGPGLYRRVVEDDNHRLLYVESIEGEMVYYGGGR